jgi:NTP pyrophosphatase (non-canonical NTP hydrolase)
MTSPGLAIRLRPEILRFALDMEENLLRNDHKGGWEGMTVNQLFLRLVQETLELTAALEADCPTDIISECADIGNFAMMIAEKTKKEVII